MLVLHVHVMGKSGTIERTYDFLRNDGKDSLDGCDVIIPYGVENSYPIVESDAMAIISNKNIRGDH